MPNRFTRVPDRPVPPLPRWARALVPPADAFMVLMVSRPRTGSLLRTWVTPATLQLCVAVAVAGLACGAFLVIAGTPVVRAFGAALLVVSAGAAAVAAVGVAQRRA